MIEQLQSLADGLYQIGKGPTSLWLYVKDGVLHVPTKGLNPIAWLSCVVTVVNVRTFIRAAMDSMKVAAKFSSFFCITSSGFDSPPPPPSVTGCAAPMLVPGAIAATSAARCCFRGARGLPIVDAREPGMHFAGVSKPKKAKPSEAARTPGTVMAAKIRARANKLTDSERAALMGDAMRIIYGPEGDAVRAHRR